LERATKRLAVGKRVLSADCERRERQRQMKNDEAQPSPEAAREEFFRGVEPEADGTLLPTVRWNGASGRSPV
jgi:hypothetical protein